MTSRLTTHQFHNKRPSMHLKVAGERALSYTQGTQGYNHAINGALSVPYMQALANMSVVVCRRYFFQCF